MGPFANGSEPTLIQIINGSAPGVEDDNMKWQNNDSANRYYEAQKRADMYSKLKERRPMVFEYMQTPGKWTSIQMYINPDRLAITNQKVKGKAYTRGGIFYHHWGDDNPIMTLSGTTGMSGMKGIEVLEEIYYASGTLLKYQKFGPEKYEIRTGQQDTNIDFNSPMGTFEHALNMNTASQMKDLQSAIGADQTKLDKWTEYKNAVKLLEDLTNGNSELLRLSRENVAIKDQHMKLNWMQTLHSITVLNEGRKEYKTVWESYSSDKKKYETDKTLTAAQKQQLMQKMVTVNNQYGLESNVNVSYVTTKSVKEAAFKDVDRFIANAIAYQNLKPKVGNSSVDIVKQQAKVTELKNKYGFPSGTYAQLSRMQLPNSSKEINNMKGLTSSTVDLYAGVTDFNSFLNQTSAIDSELDMLVNNSSKRMSSAEYKAMALKFYKERFPTTDDSLITAIVSQKVTYYESGITNSVAANSFSSQQSPIPYSQDIIGQIIDRTQERTEALNYLLTEMAQLEKSEKDFFDQLRETAFENVMDELEDNWKPRQIVIYYENRAYLGHFDAFSYTRDAANPLVIRYEMRLTLTKQVIGTAAE